MNKNIILLQDGNVMYLDRFEGKMNRIAEKICELGIKSSFINDINADAIISMKNYDDIIFRYAFRDTAFKIVSIQTIEQIDFISVNLTN